MRLCDSSQQAVVPHLVWPQNKNLPAQTNHGTHRKRERARCGPVSYKISELGNIGIIPIFSREISESQCNAGVKGPLKQLLFFQVTYQLTLIFANNTIFNILPK